MLRLATYSSFHAAVVVVLLAGTATAASFITKDDALARAFPNADVVRRAVTVTDEQALRIESLSGDPLSSRLVYPYEAVIDGQVTGTAYFDVHKVRTLPETLLIVVSTDGTVRSVEILAFNEPLEYMASDRWLDQFDGRELSERLMLRQDIDGITGATLTARSITRAVRQTLAIHRVLNEGKP